MADRPPNRGSVRPAARETPRVESYARRPRPAGGSNEPTEETTDAECAEQHLAEIRRLLVPGAVFWLSDRDTGRTMKPARRPVMLVGPTPDLDGRAEAVVTRLIRVSTRTSEKGFHVTPLTDSEALFLLEEKGLLYTPARLLPGFTKDGYFEIGRRTPVAIQRLNPDAFAGWLPRPFVDVILLKMTGHRARMPYPPSES